MRAALPTTLLLGAVAAALACQTAPTDQELIGVWTNDDDASITLTIVPNLGGPEVPASEFTGTLMGALLSPDSQGRLLIDVRRDALYKPLLTIPAYASQGVKDILCEGCDVSGGHMTCDQAFATTTDPATGGVVAVGRSCHWTQTSVPASCRSVAVSSACPPTGCPSPGGPRCAGGFCETGSVCTLAGSCQCNPGLELACCDGTPCPTTGCTSCTGGALDYGCVPSAPVGCADDLLGWSGSCTCASGRVVPFGCGANAACETLCGGSLAESGAAPGVDAGSADTTAPDVGSLPASCSGATCGGCCTGNVCYAGITATACGQLGVDCVTCPGSMTCVSGTCTAGGT